MIEPSLQLFVAVFTATLFFISGVAKLIDRSAFSSAVEGYDLLPRFMTPFVTYVVPLAEILAAALICLPRVGVAGAILSMTLLFSFGVVVSLNLLRGRRDISCGCFGRSTKAGLSWFLVFRNLALICLLVTFFRSNDHPRLSTIDTILVTLTGIATLLSLWLANVLVDLLSTTASQSPLGD